MTTYSELVTQIRDYTETDSNVFTTVIVNDFIEHAELKIFRDIDLDVFRKYQTAALTSGDAFVGMPGATPTSFSFIRSVNIFSPSGSLGGLTDGERRYLEKKDTSFISEYSPSRTSTGIPKYYANWDNDTIILAPTPNAAYTIELAYNTTTWVSTNTPQLLLYACLVEAFMFLKAPDMLNIYALKYREELQTLGQEQMGRRRRDEYMDGVVRVPIPSANP